jgi:hypothetical protein
MIPSVETDMKKFEGRMIDLFKAYDAMKEVEHEENNNLELNKIFRQKLFDLTDYVSGLIIDSEKYKYGELLTRLQDLERKTGGENIYDVNKEN